MDDPLPLDSCYSSPTLAICRGTHPDVRIIKRGSLGRVMIPYHSMRKRDTRRDCESDETATPSQIKQQPSWSDFHQAAFRWVPHLRPSGALGNLGFSMQKAELKPNRISDLRHYG